MSDIQDLIIEVEKYPCLWNPCDENYQNKVSRSLAWEQICQTLITDWSNFNSQEKKSLCEEQKKKWNNLRDGYRKYLNRVKNTPTGLRGQPRKNYIFKEDLYFLTPIFDKKRPREGKEGSLPSSPQEVCEYYEEITEQTDKESTEEDEEEHYRRKMIRKAESANIRSKRKKNETEDVPQQILNILQQRNAVPNFQDDDSQFLLSFRNDLKSMSRAQKLNFKLGMIQLVKSYTTESRPSSIEKPNLYFQEI